jgi:RHS repeat-associated protein
VTSTTVNGGNAIAFQYANDNFLTQAGSLVLNRNAHNGLLMGSALGGVADAWGYNGFAEPFTYTVSYNAASLYSVQYERDRLGRITQKSETVGGATDVYSYTYDLVGRLTSVGKNGLVAESYTYDANSNRLNANGPGGLVAGVYDAQDRLTQYGATTYGYSAAGELMTKTNAGQTTAYSYDELGNLLGVTLPNGTVITYLVDGQNQRIGKRVNGVLTQRFLYEGNLRPIAELDGGGTLVSRFVYATRLNVPDYMVRGGVTYRILTDHLGSPRLVVDVASGIIAQRMDYDSFGKVLTDTNPGFQPFGFAGGLYDTHTKLVRFGARDYDAETGRWTAKDPLLFAPGEPNLYAYVSNDPINRIDPDGLWGTARGVTVGLGFLTGGSISAGWGFDTSHGFFLYYAAGLGPHAGISAGCGVEATFFKDFDQFTGKGFEAGLNAPIGGLAFSGGDSLNAISISLGPSIGGDVHVYSTYTGTTKSTDPAEDLPPTADPKGVGPPPGKSTCGGDDDHLDNDNLVCR